MARIKKQSKKNKNSSKYLKSFIVGIFLLFLIVFAFRNGFSYVRNAEIFKVKKVVVAPALQFIDDRYYQKVVGQSIFSVDLTKVQNRLESRYPQIDKLKVFRRFPDEILIAAKTRDPFAFFLFNDRKVLLDKSGFVLSLSGKEEEKWPFVKGVPVFEPVVLGQQFHNRHVAIALEIIKKISDNQYLSSRKVKVLDVGNLSKIILLFSDDLLIIMDTAKIDEKLQKLGIVLAQGNINLEAVEYIDIRNEDPALGPKKE